MPVPFLGSACSLLFLRCRPSDSTEGGYFYLQPFFSRVVDDVFEVLGNPVIDPVRSALTANRSRHFPDDDNTKFQIRSERRRPGFFCSSAEKA